MLHPCVVVKLTLPELERENVYGASRARANVAGVYLCDRSQRSRAAYSAQWAGGEQEK